MLAVNKNVSVKGYHKELGHPNITVTRSTAKAQNMILNGTPEICKDCLIAKAKNKSVKSESAIILRNRIKKTNTITPYAANTNFCGINK